LFCNELREGRILAMKQNRYLILMIVITGLLIGSSVLAAPNASLLYRETDLGSDQWQYDYTFYNISTSGEALYNIWFDFNQTATVTGLPLPAGWDGTVWEGMNTTSWINTFSTTPAYNIVAGSSLGGFSFVVSYKAEAIPFTAYFNNGTGQPSYISGSTTVVPEPISSLLFLTGGAIIAMKRFLKRKI